MITIKNFDSGSLEIVVNDQPLLVLERNAANRLILAARMKSIDEFSDKLPSLLNHEALASTIRAQLTELQGSDRWNLKEKFARLRTVTTNYQSQDPTQVIETIVI